MMATWAINTAGTYQLSATHILWWTLPARSGEVRAGRSARSPRRERVGTRRCFAGSSPWWSAVTGVRR
jgi:hypothetical protein